VKDGVAKLCARHGSERVVEAYESRVSHQCPVCFSTVFERIGPGRYRCPVCCSVGEEREEGIYFPAEGLNRHRFTPEKVKAHLEEWILRTRGGFRKRLPDIAKAVKDLGI
jgi:ribosomal protein L37AE/L43A